ncbi:MAG: BatA domain-containing protein, partial [Daejeonella sp.]|nr:BatA domain-containing protein [Daejeonella sp.]
MFQLLNPIWLFGISGIIIPLLIHLWNVKKGKTLKIGSVSLLGESSRQNARSLRLLDLLLLLLRCLLIIIVSMLLAEPVWISSNSPAQKGGWILIEKDNFTETYSNFQKEIDS